MGHPAPSTGGAAPADDDSAAPRSAEAWRAGDVAHLGFDAAALVAVFGYIALAFGLGVGAIDRAGPGFFPVVAGSVCATFLAIDLGRVVLRLARDTALPGSGRVPRRVVVIVLAIAVYIGLVGLLGHAVTGSIVAAILVAATGQRSPRAVVFYAIAIGFGTDLVFSTALGLRLPGGIFDISFSSWI